MGLAPRNLFAAVNANGRRRGVKVWLKHKRTMRLLDEAISKALTTRANPGRASCAPPCQFFFES